MPSLSKWADKDESHQSGRELLLEDGVEAAQCLLGHTRSTMTERYARQALGQRKLATAINAAKKLG